MRERRNHPSSNKRRMNVTGRVPSNVVQYPGNRAGTGRTGGPTRYKASRKAAPSKVTPLYIWGDFDIPFLLLTLALLGFGLVMLFSASYARAYYYKDSSFYYIRRQIMWSIIGVVGMIAASFVNYHWLRKFVWPLYAVSIALCMACYLFEAENGANRWVRIGPVNFQPSEIAKFALILLFAHLMSRDQDKMDQLWLGTARYLALFGAMALVILPQPHLSATLLLLGITLSMMFVGGSRIKHLMGLGMLGVSGMAIIVLAMPTFFAERFNHVLTRLTYWLDPFSTTDSGAYQTKQKQLYLPEVQNDFIFAIVCEELGFVGACLIIVLFALLIWRGYTIALHAKDRFGMLIAVGITTQIGMQVMLNIAVVTNTIPNTGISLPMFSYGGTSLCMILGELGILLAVSRQGIYEKE